MGLNQGDVDHRQISKNPVWLLPGAIVVVAVLVAVTGDWGRELLRYDRGAISEGDIWRLVSGHIVHLGWSHFLLNSAGLLLIFYLVASRFTTRQWLIITIVAIAGIDIGFWFWQPQLIWYVGLSGLLHGFLAAGAVDGIRTGQVDYWLIGAFLLFKLSYEQLLGPLPGSEGTSGGNVVVAAHLYGAISGVLIGFYLSFRKAHAAAI
jgi:rhomboid family GlyGly-CTERM serine protease